MCLTNMFGQILFNSLTALNLQRAGLGVQGKAAEIHVAHSSDCDSAGKTGRTHQRSRNLSFKNLLMQVSKVQTQAGSFVHHNETLT